MRLEHRLVVAAPVSRVWELTVDVEALPEVTPTMTMVERLDKTPLGVGSRVRIKQPAQLAKIWTVTAFEVGRRFTWVTESAVLSMAASHELREVPEGTENTLSVDIGGRLAGVLGPLIAIPIRRAIATENRAIQTAAESRER